MEAMQTYKTSKHYDDLCFRDAPLGDAVYFELPFDSYVTEGRILYNDAHEEPWVLSVHGARGDFTKTNVISFALQELGYSLVGMSLSGHSKASSVAPEDTSLANNIKETEAFFKQLNPQRKKIVIGYSMGATSALKLLTNHASEIDKLILFYPAVYDAAAYTKPFGDEFKAAISRPYSYRDTDTFKLLRTFPGKVMLIMGEFDGLDPQAYGKPAGGSAGTVEVDGRTIYSPIPKEVVDTIRTIVPAHALTYMVVPDCDHSIAPHLRENAQLKEEVMGRIQQFLAN